MRFEVEVADDEAGQIIQRLRAAGFGVRSGKDRRSVALSADPNAVDDAQQKMSEARRKELLASIDLV
jgi:hypothetical protein